MSDSFDPVVLDASAVLAFILGEPGGENVQPRFLAGKMSHVNYAEVLARLTGRGMPILNAKAAVDDLNLDLLPFTAEQAVRSAELRPLTRSAGLSLGDRACLALAFELGLPVLTADRAWSSVVGRRCGRPRG